MTNTAHTILLFDGICNLCNETVKFVIRYDKNEHFKFASLQSVEGQNLLKKHRLPTKDFNSFVMVKDNKVYTKSTAALMVCKTLGGAWSLLYLFIILPKPFRDAIYTYIAKHRYKWFGKKEECMIPTPEMKKRFLS
ncbi:thiol-disulfide oxidoreductase DCC family protein [Metabacillus sp. HB246100]|uniref:thiol-disulfide oxidoreductase DCC family protein n=1 Tax=Bacillus weihaiensis TaxID=1547283 RepID=UPI002354C68E|nr:thiol-disulfide oxidoreductase DCC family protein [Bacillus weihaiensis]